jgi:hypothetical protein
MSGVLHITSGDGAGGSLAKAGLPGEVFVWHDVLYDGPRGPGWPDEPTLRDRARFLERTTGGGLDQEFVMETLVHQYRVLEKAAADRPIVLWFDACLFDQSMLAHVLACLAERNARSVELLCIDAFPGVEPYHGLGQLTPEQLASRYGDRRPVTVEQFRFAEAVDRAFASRDVDALADLARTVDASLPWIPAAVERWLQERPDPVTGLGRLEDMALSAIRAGCDTPEAIYAAVTAAETPPQYWGDITLWAAINGLADRVPPLVTIDGPADRLPQWESDLPFGEFSIKPLTEG